MFSVEMLSNYQSNVIVAICNLQNPSAIDFYENWHLK